MHSLSLRPPFAATSDGAELNLIVMDDESPCSIEWSEDEGKEKRVKDKICHL
jgi:hypothetical protein